MANYDVDYVFPYVSQRDLNWQVTYKKVSQRLGRPINLNSQRFRDWDNIQYIFRGIQKFMPWIRKIHFIVCAPSQIPIWMDQENVSIVYHKDIIPREYRPTFNSCTIEMFLKNIPDLAEHFIYANDDLFVTGPMKKEDFFTDGYPNLHYRKVYYSDSQNMFRHQCKQGLDMISRDYNVFCNGFLFKNTHSAVPMLKSTLDKVWNRHEEEIRNSISQFREEKNINQYIYSYDQYMSGNFVDHVFPNLYTSFADYSLNDVCNIIKSGTPRILCINDAGKSIKFGFYKEMIKRAFNHILPEKSKYEL